MSYITGGSKERLLYWDIAKGITIILVVMGHIDGVYSIIRAAIFSFHMPFFFVANAYFLKDYNVIQQMKKSGKTLLIPYAFTCIISTILNILISGGTDIKGQLLRGVRDMCVGMSKTSTHFKSFGSVWLIWFVICLFATKIIFVLVSCILENVSEIVKLLVIVLLSASGIVIGLRYSFLPWSLDVALAALLFYWFGEILHKYQLLEKSTFPIYGVCFLIWVVLGYKGFGIEMAIRSYPGYFVTYITALTGCMVLLGISLILDKKVKRTSKLLAWCGANSMIILIVHCLEMRFINWKALVGNQVYSNWFGMFIIRIAFVLIVASLYVYVKGKIINDKRIRSLRNK